MIELPPPQGKAGPVILSFLNKDMEDKTASQYLEIQIKTEEIWPANGKRVGAGVNFSYLGRSHVQGVCGRACSVLSTMYFGTS